MSNCTINMPIGAEDIDFEVEFNFIPGKAGYYSGLPEDCYPGEPDELEILKVSYDDTDLSSILELPGIAEEVEKLVMEEINNVDDF